MSSKTIITPCETRRFYLALATIKPGPSKKHHDKRIKKACYHFFCYSFEKRIARDTAMQEALRIACGGDQKRYDIAIGASAKPYTENISAIRRLMSIGGNIIEKLKNPAAPQFE